MRGNFNVAGTLKIYEIIFMLPPMFYYTYILESEKNHSLYIGYTSDLRKRFLQHNNGESQATKPFRPYKLIFYEAFLQRIDAKRREKYLKGGYGRKTINKILSRYFESNV